MTMNKRLNNMSNNFKGAYCIDCMEDIHNCACNEIAFTKLDTVELEGNKYIVTGETQGYTGDCSTCTSYCCTECPRYTTY